MLLVRHDPSSAALVRHEVADELRRAQVTPDSVDDVLLVVSELVGNAVVHTEARDSAEPGPDGLDVAWDVREDEVIVRVNDPSTDRPTVLHVHADSRGGRGLAIVAALAAEWGVRPVARGKQVWARIPVRRAV